MDMPRIPRLVSLLSPLDYVLEIIRLRAHLHCTLFTEFPHCRRSLCEGLLQKSPSNRLGCSRGRHGVMEVKIHPWFNSINWRRMESGRIKPEFTPDPHAVYAKVRIRTIRRLSEYIINHGPD